MEKNLDAPSQRRRFLLAIVGGIGAVLAGMVGWPIFKYLAPREKSGAAAKVTVPLAQLTGDAHFFDYHGRPAVLLQLQPGVFVALSAVCTHLGCIVKWVTEKQEFLCPCHGGRFSPKGAVLGGPPPKPLESYPVTVQGDTILVG